MKPTAYILVGVPASGKTTWIENQIWAKDCVVTSTDKYVDKYAMSKNKTYSEVFNGYMPIAIDFMLEDVCRAREDKKDLIWDQTSTTVASRAKKFKMLKPDYRMIAVVFQTPSRIELKRRLNNRPGKEIPEIVVEAMLASFEMPTLEEGFDEIWNN
jgi:predicted kinase